MIETNTEPLELKKPEWWSGKRVLVTGASGFKGSWLGKVLLELGSEVYGTVSRRVSPLSSYSLLGLDSDIRTVVADISDRQQVFDMLNTTAPDVIFHLAATAQVPIANRDPLRAFDVNIMGTLNILEGCRQLGVGRRLLVVSTDHVFGNIAEEHFDRGANFERGVAETYQIDYSGLYDTSKSAMELCVRSYHHAYWADLPAIGITRAANVYGYGDVAARRVLPNFVRKAIDPPHVIPLSCRRNGRQFICVTDAVAGYIRAAASLNDDDPTREDDPDYKKSLSESFPAARSHETFTPTFHFAAAKYSENHNTFIRIKELAEMVASTLGAAVEEEPDCTDYAPNENAVLALNSQITESRLQWEPKINLVEGIEKLGEWYRHIDDFDALRELLKEDVQRVVSAL